MNSETTAAELVAILRTALEAGDYRAMVKATSGNPFASTIWSSAMTAHFGPTWIHKDWTDAEGRPTAEAIEKFDSVAFAMQEARDRLPGLISHLDRFGYY